MINNIENNYYILKTGADLEKFLYNSKKGSLLSESEIYFKNIIFNFYKNSKKRFIISKTLKNSIININYEIYEFSCTQYTYKEFIEKIEENWILYAIQSSAKLCMNSSQYDPQLIIYGSIISTKYYNYLYEQLNDHY